MALRALVRKTRSSNQGADDRLANEERSRWVLDISHAMRLVTQSIFPAFKVTLLVSRKYDSSPHRDCF